MKKNILKYLLLLVFGAFASCKTTQVARFTSVENLFQIKLYSSLEDVISLLGSKPYNILSSQVGGYTIYTYKYKFVERIVGSKLINSRGGETAGKEVYYGKEQTVYLFFKENKLESFITSEGRNNSSSLIVLNNTLYTLAKGTSVINKKTQENSDAVNREKLQEYKITLEAKSTKNKNLPSTKEKQTSKTKANKKGQKKDNSALPTTFKKFDKDLNGTISYAEIINMIDSFFENDPNIIQEDIIAVIDFFFQN